MLRICCSSRSDMRPISRVLLFHSVMSTLSFAQIMRATNQATDRNVREMFFDQQLDHFGKSKATFKQRFFSNTLFFKSNGPIFLYVSGEGAAQPTQIAKDSSYASQLAQLYNGALLLLEHRYYGKSKPKNGGNFTYLNSKQAIEDVAQFVQGHSKFPEYRNSKWILTGCSYSGSLVAWFREKHPELTVGSISYSAPLEVRMDFGDYTTAVSEGLWRIDQNCAGRIRDGLQLLNAELLLNQTRQEAINDLHLDNPNMVQYDPETSKELIMTELLFVIGGMLQSRPRATIQQLCHNLVDDLRRPLIPMLSELLKNRTKFEEDGYEENGWTYQLCNEFGWFMAAGERTQQSQWPDIFHMNVSLESASAFCRGVLGNNYKPNWTQAKVTETRKYYGSRKDLNVANVVFVEGENDPWKPLQMEQRFMRSNNVLVVVKGGTHCEGLYPSYDENVRKAQSVIHAKVIQWLGLSKYNNMGGQAGYNNMGGQAGYNNMGGQAGYNNMGNPMRRPFTNMQPWYGPRAYPVNCFNGFNCQQAFYGFPFRV